MWGQGLNRTKRFSWLISTALAASAGKDPVIAWDRSRSGAKINADRHERSDFINTFPEMFRRPSHRRTFMGGQEERASELYGDIPATFPTITWQVSNLDEVVGKTIKVALVSGGANDMGLENLIDPEQFEGRFVTEWDGIIRRIAYDEVTRVLELVRERCPSAVIIYFGYFAPFSYASSMKKFRAMAKYFNANDYTWAANKVFGFKDIDSILWEIQARSVWAISRALYWQKQAVTRVNLDSALRGPGILFSPSGYTPDNSVFGPSSLLHEDYTHPTTDDLQSRRELECPRVANLPLLTRLSAPPADRGGRADRRALTRIRDDLTGPAPLIDQLTNLIETLGGGLDRSERDRLKQTEKAEKAAWSAVNRRAREDASRIQRTLIASLLHPNPAGARRYAEIAIERYTRHMRLAAQIRRDERRPLASTMPPLAGGQETVSDMLRRFGLRGQGSLLADIGHLDVDSIGVFTVTARDSDRLLVPHVFLVVDTKTSTGQIEQRRYQLNMPIRLVFHAAVGAGPPWVIVKKFYPEFEPATSHQFTVDPGKPLLLSEISGISIAMGDDDLAGKLYQGDHGSVWRPRRIIVEFNGQTVHDQTFRSQSLTPGQTLRFAYPPAPPKDPGSSSTRTTRTAARSGTDRGR